MSSLFVEDEETTDKDVLNLLYSNEVSLNEADANEFSKTSDPLSAESAGVNSVYEQAEIRCSLPLRFHQKILETLVSKDGLLLMGRGLGWEITISNFLHALSMPLSQLQQKDVVTHTKKNLLILLNATDDENSKISEKLIELDWIEKCNENGLNSSFDTEPLVFLGSEGTTVEKRRKIYAEGGIISISSRILVVDLLSEILRAQDITGMIVLHAEKVKETSNESFIIALYREKNTWGFLKAVSDSPESFTGFTPLASKLKALSLHDTFLWPRFHVEVSASLNYYHSSLSKRQKDKIRSSAQVTEINVGLTYKMKKIQSAILSCIQACLMELKRFNPIIANEYWDMENIHDADFVRNIRIGLESQWHRISWTSKKLVADLSLLKDLLTFLLVKDSVTFYEIIQEIIDQNVKPKIGGTISPTPISPWLNLDEATTIISYAKERAFGKMKISNDANGVIARIDEGESDVYVLEELPKWNQLQLAVDDALFEKASNPLQEGPILISCSSSSIAMQLKYILADLKDKLKQSGNQKYYSNRGYMIEKLRNHIFWRNYAGLAKELKNNLDNQENKEDSTADNNNEKLEMSKTFTRGKGMPVGKRRRTRGASSVAAVNMLYSGSSRGKNFEEVDLDTAIVERMTSINEAEEKPQGEYINVVEDDSGDDLNTNHKSQIKRQNIELIPVDEEILIYTYEENLDESLLMELCPSHIIMYEPNLSFIRSVEIYQAINRKNAAKVLFMYYGSSVEEELHLMNIKKEKESFSKLIREKASLAKQYYTAEDNNRFRNRKEISVNTRIAGGRNFRTESDELKVIVDVREFRSPLPNIAFRAGLKIVPCMLTVGDYVLSPKVCVERKAIPDLISSFKSGRLFLQCEQMFRHYQFPTLLIEFDEFKSFSLEPFADLRPQKASSTSSNPVSNRLSKQDIQMKLMMLLISFPKLKIIWSSSPYETAEIFMEIKASQEEPDVNDAVEKGLNSNLGTEDGGPPVLNEDAIDFIQTIPGINNANYFNIINKVKSISQLVNLSLDEFTHCLGIENGTKAFNFINYSVK